MKTPTGVAPVILSLYPQLDAGQLELISSLDGPTLGVAGPGAGKTLMLALRGANILLRGLATPEELLLCTYNADAAGELRQRFDAVASAADYGVNIGRARVGTIHSLCGRLLAEHPERVGLRRGFRLLDKHQQSNLLQQRFDDVFGPDLRDLKGRGWRSPPAVVKGALKYFERICDEVINPRDLTRSRSSFIAAVGRCYRRYERLLLDENAADFAHLQAWADLLLDDDDVADAISGGIRYLMCDEYQDTSHVQERILTNVVAVSFPNSSFPNFRICHYISHTSGSTGRSRTFSDRKTGTSPSSRRRVSSQPRRIVFSMCPRQSSAMLLCRGERAVRQPGISDHEQCVLQGVDRRETFDVPKLARYPDHLLEQPRRLQINLSVCRTVTVHPRMIAPVVSGRFGLSPRRDPQPQRIGFVSDIPVAAVDPHQAGEGTRHSAIVDWEAVNQHGVDLAETRSHVTETVEVVGIRSARIQFLAYALDQHLQPVRRHVPPFVQFLGQRRPGPLDDGTSIVDKPVLLHAVVHDTDVPEGITEFTKLLCCCPVVQPIAVIRPPVSVQRLMEGGTSEIRSSALPLVLHA